MDIADDPELLLATAAKFLIEGGEKNAASVLLGCSRVEIVGVDELFPLTGDGVDITLARAVLHGPRWVYDLVTGETAAGKEVCEHITNALRALLPDTVYVDGVWARIEVGDLAPNWRADLQAIARNNSVTNQAAGGGDMKIWKGLRFRSHVEVRIADALDQAKVLFFPNCRGRLNGPGGRINKEADFLVCHNGRWGVLEVDGEPFHPPAMAAEDHERQRLFQHHGIRVFQRYRSSTCYDDPHGVVREFLQLLSKL